MPINEHADLGPTGPLKRSICSGAMMLHRSGAMVDCRPGTANYSTMSSFHVEFNGVTVKSIAGHVIEMIKNGETATFRAPSCFSRTLLYSVATWDDKSVAEAHDVVDRLRKSPPLTNAAGGGAQEAEHGGAEVGPSMDNSEPVVSVSEANTAENPVQQAEIGGAEVGPSMDNSEPVVSVPEANTAETPVQQAELGGAEAGPSTTEPVASAFATNAVGGNAQEVEHGVEAGHPTTEDHYEDTTALQNEMFDDYEDDYYGNSPDEDEEEDEGDFNAFEYTDAEGRHVHLATFAVATWRAPCGAAPLRPLAGDQRSDVVGRRAALVAGGRAVPGTLLRPRRVQQSMAPAFPRRRRPPRVAGLPPSRGRCGRRRS